ncbi:MAG: hypothetical protein INH43_09935 [Acidobacteriaceae bacterium]|jgi:hypothetical protein|nr:hypothetical protein [Acidobacteriaceae bacterium]
MQSSTNSHKEKYFLSCLFFAIGFLYLISFDLKGIWTDEGLRIQLMNGNRHWQEQMISPDFATYEEVLRAIAPFPYQPFYYLLGNSLFRLGNTDSEVVVRGINVLFLFLSMMGLRRFARTWDWRTRLFLLLVYALNGYMMMHIMQVREYPLYQAILIWSSAVFFDLLETPIHSPNGRFWCLLGIYTLLVIVGYYTHSYLLLVFPIQAAFAFFRQEYRRKFIYSIGASYAVSVLAALPWIRYSFGLFPNRHDSVILDHRPATLPLFLDTMRQGFRAMLAYEHDQGTSWVDYYAVFAGVAILVAISFAVRSWRSIDLRFLFGLISLLVFLGFQASYFFLRQPMSVWVRYFIGNYFGLSIMIAFAFQLLLRISDARDDPRTPLWRWIPVAVTCLSAFAGLTQVARFREQPFMDTILRRDCEWEAPARAIMAVAKPGDTVVFYHPMQAWTMSRYYRGMAKESNYDEILYGNFPARASKTIWVLDTNVELELVPKVFSRIEAYHYVKSGVQTFGCGVKLVKFENIASTANERVPEKAVDAGPFFEQRRKDLKALEIALTAYHKDNGSYPLSSGGFDGYFTNYGKATPKWIPGIVPKYIKALPRDPRLLEKADPQYYYWSDGMNFKLIVHAPEDCSLVKEKLPALIDPIRDCWSYGFWSEGAANR